MRDAIDWRDLDARDGFELSARLYYDSDSTPDDYDCFTPKQVQAWRNDEWQFVGLVITASIAGTELGRASCWSVESGLWTDTDENDNVTGTRVLDPLRDDDYLNDLIPEAIADARANLARINEKVTTE